MQPCKHSIHPLCSLLPEETCFLLASVEFSSQVKHEDSDLFPKNGTSAVIREGNILKMQRKQKPCTPLPSNKQSRYYRPRVKVSTRTDSWSDFFCSSKTNIYLIFCTVSEGVWVFALSQGRFVSKAYFLQQQQALEKTEKSWWLSGLFSSLLLSRRSSSASQFSFLQRYSAADVEWHVSCNHGDLMVVSLQLLQLQMLM